MAKKEDEDENLDEDEELDEEEPEEESGEKEEENGEAEVLEKEIIKRNPTPVEKLEMRSLDSFPFNQKLTDYWAEKEGPYDVMGNDKKKEYVLTKDDIDADFSPTNIKQSFNVDPQCNLIQPEFLCHLI